MAEFPLKKDKPFVWSKLGVFLPTVFPNCPRIDTPRLEPGIYAVTACAEGPHEVAPLGAVFITYVAELGVEDEGSTPFLNRTASPPWVRPGSGKFRWIGRWYRDTAGDQPTLHGVIKRLKFPVYVEGSVIRLSLVRISVVGRQISLYLHVEKVGAIDENAVPERVFETLPIPSR